MLIAPKYLPKKDEKFIFRIRKRKEGNHWQIVELMDFPNLKKLMI